MKKLSRFVAMVITLVLVTSISPLSVSIAESSSFADSGMTIMAAYPIWADIFGLTDIDRNIESDVTNDGLQTMLQIDNLFIFIDQSTFKLQRLILAYKHDGISTLEADLRAMALFAAIECPKIPDDSEIKEVRSLAIQELKELKSTLTSKKADIDAGQFVAFHIGRDTIYYLYQGGDILGIIVE